MLVLVLVLVLVPPGQALFDAAYFSGSISLMPDPPDALARFLARAVYCSRLRQDTPTRAKPAAHAQHARR